MKKTILLLFLLFFLHSNAENCDYKVFNYEQKSILINFNCDTISSFKVMIYNSKKVLISNFYYKPDLAEKVFLINFPEQVEGEQNFFIEINYLNETKRFLYTKK
jgi:hypothetical protein